MRKPKSRKTQRKHKGGKLNHPLPHAHHAAPAAHSTRKKLNCHPKLKKHHKLVPGTCMPLEILEELKTKYNQSHPKHPLLATEPKQIYEELSQRFSDSYKAEKCLIQTFLPKSLPEIEKYLYSPTSPADWKKNPTEWLSNFDIEAVMNQYEEAYHEFEFLGPVPIDFDKRFQEGDESTCVSRDVCAFHLAQKIRQGKTKVGIVFNLSPSTSSGSHWVSLYVHLPDSLMKSHHPSSSSGKAHHGGHNEGDDDSFQGPESGTGMATEDGGAGKGRPWGHETAYCYFFDSVGDSAPTEVKALVERLQKEWKTNRKLNPRKTEMFYDCNHRTNAEHQKGNTECGVYSLFFLTTMLTGECAGGVVEKGEFKEAEICRPPFKSEQEKVDYFLGKDGEKGETPLRIPDKFMVKLRERYFNPHP